MLHALNELLAPAALERLTLLINHVLAQEAAATQRMRVHAGRSIVVLPERWPALLPPLPPLAFRVTPAGLLEWCGMVGAEAPDLRVRVDASNPARLAFATLAGETPQVQIEGAAQLATDVNWLIVNVRWDVADELQRLFGPAAAQALQGLGSWLARGLRAAMQGANSLAQRVKPPAR
jgi:ubiquinone biosynthesis protein UbiJ